MLAVDLWLCLTRGRRSRLRRELAVAPDRAAVDLDGQTARLRAFAVRASWSAGGWAVAAVAALGWCYAELRTGDTETARALAPRRTLISAAGRGRRATPAPTP